jgi:hypothetical protein
MGIRDPTQSTLKSLQLKLTQKHRRRGKVQNDLIQNWVETHKKTGDGEGAFSSWIDLSENIRLLENTMTFGRKTLIFLKKV